MRVEHGPYRGSLKERGLGELERTYRTASLREVMGWRFQGALVVSGVLTAALLQVGLYPLALLALSATLVSFFVLLARWTSHRRATIAIHERGLRLTEGGRAREMLWDEIDEVWVALEERGSSAAAPHWTYRLKGSSGEVTITDRFARIDELGTKISAATLHVARLRLADALRRGDPLVFGDHVITSSGLSIRGNELSWSGIDKVVLERGDIRVHLRSEAQPFSSPLATVPNGHVFVWVAARLREKVATIERR